MESKTNWQLDEVVMPEDMNRIEGNISEVNTNLGDEILKTTAKTCKGAINEVFTSASNGKAAIATAITGKGVATNPTDTYSQMAINIGNIQTGIILPTLATPAVASEILRGKQVIDGSGNILTGSMDPNNTRFYSTQLVTKNSPQSVSIDMSGLGFNPNKFIMYKASPENDYGGGSSFYCACCSSNDMSTFMWALHNKNGMWVSNYGGSTSIVNNILTLTTDSYDRLFGGIYQVCFIKDN